MKWLTEGERSKTECRGMNGRQGEYGGRLIYEEEEESCKEKGAWQGKKKNVDG